MMKQTYRSILYIDDVTKMTLLILNCLQSIVTVNNTGTEKQQKVSKAKIVGQCTICLSTLKCSHPDASDGKIPYL